MVSPSTRGGGDTGHGLLRTPKCPAPDVAGKLTPERSAPYTVGATVGPFRGISSDRTRLSRGHTLTDPTYEQTTLPNGLRILTSTMPHTRSVTIGIVVGGGSRYETDAEAGAFHFIEHLYFKGTSQRPTAREISETIEGVGGYMNASTDREITTYWCKVAQPHFATALDLLLDMLRNSLFDPEELEKERSVILEELAMSNDHPDERVGLLSDEVVWPDQPLGRDVGGTPTSVANLSRDVLLDCMGRQYVPSNAVVTVAGNVTHAEVVEMCGRHLGDWKRESPGRWYPAMDAQDAPRVRVESRKSDQAHICLAIRGLAAEDPQRYALDLLSIVLGEGMSSRLFLELREKRALVYDVHAAAGHLRDTGTLAVYSAADPKHAAQALAVGLEEMEKLKDVVPPEELAKAKELAKGRLLLRMEDTRAVAFWMGTQALLRDRVSTVDEVAEKLDRTTRDEVASVARELIRPERMNLAVVGPYRSAVQFERLFA